MTTTATRKGHGKPDAAKSGKHQFSQPVKTDGVKVGSVDAAPAAPALPDSRYVEAPPNAYKTLTALREMGYDSVASVADLVDNAIDADAKRIAIQVRAAGKGEARASVEGDTGIIIDVLDDGKGMDSATLNQALRLGSDTSHDVADLGKYGMGLVTASLGMARSVYVLTRQKGQQAYEALLDVDDVARHNRFLITLEAVTDSARVLDVLGDGGTLVRLTKIDRMDDTNIARFAATLRTRFAQTYRNFLERGVKLSVNGKLVQAADPLMRSHPETHVVMDTDLEVAGVKFHLTAVELPDLGFIGNQEAGILPHNSGVYVVRNGRQIMAAQTFGMYRHHHSYSGFRAELSFNKDADRLFHVDVMKQKIQPDERLLARVDATLKDVVAASGRAGRNREIPRGTASMKLDHATELLNERLSVPVVSPVATPVPATPDEGKAAVHANGNGKVTGAMPSLTTGEPHAPIPVAERQAKVRFEQAVLPATVLYKAVEKDGQWLIALNSAHPLNVMVADARHKAASAVLTYVAFALASAAKETKGGAEVVERIGATLASVLGTPDA